MKSPLVSIIVPTYNGLSRGFLKEALESVLNQTYSFWELIIVDDGSSDDLKAGCDHILKDDRASLIRQDNQGLSAARKTGIEYAKGDYIALLDDDDRWDKQKLARQLEFFEKCGDPKVGMVFTAIRLIDDRGRVIGVRAKKATGNIYQNLIYQGNGISAPSAVMIKMAAIKEVGNFDPQMKSLEDLDLWLRIAKSFHIYSMDQYLTDYRLHNNSITAKSFAREEEFERKLYDRVLAKEPEAGRRSVYHNMNTRFALRHFSLGNYSQARKFYSESLAFSLSPRAMILWAATWLPSGFLDWLKMIRRQWNICLVNRWKNEDPSDS
jgi:glycosyltransferase involved in cell wall biosynthesis